MQIDWQIDGQEDRQTDRHTNKQTNKQTNRKTRIIELLNVKLVVLRILNFVHNLYLWNISHLEWMVYTGSVQECI